MPPSPQCAELLRIALEHYPAGYSPERDEDVDGVPSYQLTAEHQRWQEAWRHALDWRHWDDLLERLDRSFPGLPVGDVTQAFMSACRRCCIYLPQVPVGGTQPARLVALASVLAPVYLVYATQEAVPPGQAADIQLSFKPGSALATHARTLFQAIEETLGYRPFPMECADIPLPGLRVLDVRSRTPTLLEALLDERRHFTNLP